MSLKSKRLKDIAILKKYSDDLYKLTVCYSLPNKGYEVNKVVKGVRGTVNNVKLDNNISRAKNKVFEYAMCNDFLWFITLTLDKDKYDRYDLKNFQKDLSKFINNYSRKWGSKISYILIPEMHKDCAWHIHGLLNGVSADDLTYFDDIKKAPKKLKGKNYYQWDSYFEKFGFCSLGLIREKEKVSTYVTKYISKDLNKTITELNSKLYYCSQGLKVAEEIKRGSLATTIKEYDYENDYIKLKWFHEKSPNLIIHELLY